MESSAFPSSINESEVENPPISTVFDVFEHHAYNHNQQFEFNLTRAYLATTDLPAVGITDSIGIIGRPLLYMSLYGNRPTFYWIEDQRALSASFHELASPLYRYNQDPTEVVTRERNVPMKMFSLDEHQRSQLRAAIGARGISVNMKVAVDAGIVTRANFMEFPSLGISQKKQWAYFPDEPDVIIPTWRYVRGTGYTNVNTPAVRRVGATYFNPFSQKHVMKFFGLVCRCFTDTSYDIGRKLRECSTGRPITSTPQIQDARNAEFAQTIQNIKFGFIEHTVPAETVVTADQHQCKSTFTHVVLNGNVPDWSIAPPEDHFFNVLYFLGAMYKSVIHRGFDNGACWWPFGYGMFGGLNDYNFMTNCPESWKHLWANLLKSEVFLKFQQLDLYANSPKELIIRAMCQGLRPRVFSRYTEARDMAANNFTGEEYVRGNPPTIDY
jgi:hypothetical protein